MGALIFLVYHTNVPNPNMILISAMVLFTGFGGVVPGAVSAVMMLLYSMFFFSTDHSFFQYSEINLQKIFVIIFGIIINFLVVAVLKRTRDKAEEKLKETNKYLIDINEYLAEKADAAERISALSGSIRSLLTNMPAMTYSKDINSGIYLTCNQAFAEYAGKESSKDVVGLTDREIFDPETAEHFAKADKIALSLDKPYIFVEDVTDTTGKSRHFQTTKQKFTDASGRLCILGMSIDVSELVTIRQESLKVQKAYEAAHSESVTYGHIAQALSSDYEYLYYVNIITDDFVEYTPDPASGNLSVVREQDQFFSRAQKDARILIYEKDRERFLETFTKENIIRELEQHDHFAITYRLMEGGEPVHVEMRLTRMLDDAEHIVIGVRNINKQMKDKESAERLEEERVTYARIAALSGDFIAIYTIDPETGSYQQFSGSQSYDKLGFVKSGEDFFEQAQIDSANSIYLKDQPKFRSLFTRERVMKEIRSNGVYSLTYRLIMDEEPVYVNLKATMIEDKDGSQQLIVGINNIDAQVKRDEEYEKNLAQAQSQANRDELTGVKNKHAYAELEAQLNRQIDNGEETEFAVSVFDINNLKEVNDSAGHQAGDHLLKDACMQICRIFAHSPVFRVGGDEFTVISRGNDYQNIDKLIAELDQINHDNQITGGTIIANGMSKYNGDPNVAAVFERADAAMYEKKKRLKTA